MDITEYAKTSKLPLKTLRWMVKENYINNPLDEINLIGLGLLEKLWMRRDYLRPQLRQFSKKRRLEFLEKVDLQTKWERYAYSRFKNLPENKKLSMKKLINEIEITFGFTIEKWHRDSLYRIRNRVYNLRRKQKTKQKTFVKTGKQRKRNVVSLFCKNEGE